MSQSSLLAALFACASYVRFICSILCAVGCRIPRVCCFAVILVFSSGVLVGIILLKFLRCLRFVLLVLRRRVFLRAVPLTLRTLIRRFFPQLKRCILLRFLLFLFLFMCPFLCLLFIHSFLLLLMSLSLLSMRFLIYILRFILCVLRFLLRILLIMLATLAYCSAFRVLR